MNGKLFIKKSIISRAHKHPNKTHFEIIPIQLFSDARMVFKNSKVFHDMFKSICNLMIFGGEYTKKARLKYSNGCTCLKIKQDLFHQQIKTLL